MTRKNVQAQRLMDFKSTERRHAIARARECELISAFYYKLAELQTIAEKLRCPNPINVLSLVAAAYRAADETKRIDGKGALLSEIISYH